MKNKSKKPTLAGLKRTNEIQLKTIQQWEENAIRSKFLIEDLRRKLDLAEKNTRHLITRLAQEQQISSELQSTVDSARKRIEQLLNQLSAIERNRFARQLKRFLRLEK